MADQSKRVFTKEELKNMREIARKRRETIAENRKLINKDDLYQPSYWEDDLFVEAMNEGIALIEVTAHARMSVRNYWIFLSFHLKDCYDLTFSLSAFNLWIREYKKAEGDIETSDFFMKRPNCWDFFLRMEMLQLEAVNVLFEEMTYNAQYAGRARFILERNFKQWQLKTVTTVQGESTNKMTDAELNETVNLLQNKLIQLKDLNSDEDQAEEIEYTEVEDEKDYSEE